MYECGKVKKVLGNKIGITSHYNQGCCIFIVIGDHCDPPQPQQTLPYISLCDVVCDKISKIIKIIVTILQTDTAFIDSNIT